MFGTLIPIRRETYQAHGCTYTIYVFRQVETGELRVLSYLGSDPLPPIASYAAPMEFDEDRARLGGDAVEEMVKIAKGDIDDHPESIKGKLRWGEDVSFDASVLG